MTTAVATKRRSPAKKKLIDGPLDDVEQEELDEVAIEPSRVIPPELKFTTQDLGQDEVSDEDDRTIEFELDGVACYIIAPHKLEEALAQLMEAGARRATTADALYAGRRFLERVLRADTIEHLQRRLDDDHDPFRISHLYDILEKTVRVLNKKLEEENRGRPGRGRR